MKNMLVKLILLLLLAELPGTALGDYHQTGARPDGAFVTPRLESNGSKKIVLGEIEEVKLVPWAITLPARVDTGATISALDARNVTVQNNIADFKLGSQYRSLRLRLPVIDWVQVRTSTGVERRPVVELDICLGPKLIQTLATLSDRSKMTYPLLVGRNALTGSFMVDTSLSRTARPTCSAGSF
jgi:hypothetical protein